MICPEPESIGVYFDPEETSPATVAAIVEIIELLYGGPMEITAVGPAALVPPAANDVGGPNGR